MEQSPEGVLLETMCLCLLAEREEVERQINELVVQRMHPRAPSLRPPGELRVPHNITRHPDCYNDDKLKELTLLFFSFF